MSETNVTTLKGLFLDELADFTRNRVRRIMEERQKSGLQSKSLRGDTSVKQVLD